MAETGAEPKKVCMKCGKQFSSELVVCPEDGAAPWTAPSKQQDPLLGVVLADSYEIREIIGKGGMGVVYSARQLSLDRMVAVKVLKSDLVYDEKSLLRFQVEGLAASRLKHPNVISVFDYGIALSNQPYLVMDLIEGVSLDSLPSENVDYKRAVPIFVQTCNALEHAHRNDVIHRDVKPSNIILVETKEQKDHVIVVDFGVAQLGLLADEGFRLTTTGEICGSPLYMSPEQCSGEKVDKRTDIYSLGVVMYELLTGIPPFVGKTAVDTVRKKLDENLRPFKIARPQLSVPSAIEGVVLKCLAKEPHDRFQSMEELKYALEQAMQGVEVVQLAADTGLPVIIRSDFHNVDLREELEKKALSVEKLKAKAKAESFLGVEKDEEAAAVRVDKLKSVEKPSSLPLPNLLPSLLGAVILAGTAYWYFELGGRQLLSPAQDHHYAVGVVGTRNANGILFLHTSSGGSLDLITDGQTSTRGVLRKGATAKVFYTEKNGKFHADKIIIQR